MVTSDHVDYNEYVESKLLSMYTVLVVHVVEITGVSAVCCLHVIHQLRSGLNTLAMLLSFPLYLHNNTAVSSLDHPFPYIQGHSECFHV